MDNSKEYILMCEKAVVMQKSWVPQDGDWFLGEYSIWTIGLSRLDGSDPIAVVLGENKKPIGSHIEEPLIWLPRQDQLQEMLNYQLSHLTNAFWEFFWGRITYEKLGRKYTQQFKTMEQLWLAFVMFELYSKQWLADKQEWGNEVDSDIEL